MDRQQIEELVTHLESHLECWRQFSAFVNQARAKDFDEDDESDDD